MSWTDHPITRVMTPAALQTTLAQLGIQPDDSLIVHTALSHFGFLPGGEASVVRVLKALVPQGNIVMAAQTADWSDPTTWEFPPADAAAAAQIRASMPPFDRDTTPVHFIGKTPEYFRTLPGTRRSNHPLCSMCAWGRDSARIVATPTFDLPFGKQGPLQKLYDLDAKIVQLGTDYESCTALHLADSTIGRPTHAEWAPILKDGRTEWVSYQDVELDPYDDFNELGARYQAAHPTTVRSVPIAGGTVTVQAMRPLIDFARDYYRRKDWKVAAQRAAATQN
ncbi:aminoglycoside N(3)-acetyltransferase [Levilactobacillus spicheri]